jgi:hypothetical protein
MAHANGIDGLQNAALAQEQCLTATIQRPA